MSGPTVGGEPQKKAVLDFDKQSALCIALRNRYQGIRFNRVEISIGHDHWLDAYPDDDSCVVRFSVAGTRADLERHGFAHSSWFERMPKCGVRNVRRVPGFGGASYARLTRTTTGFRLETVPLDDGLVRLAQLGPVWSPKGVRS
jgi:hypothetical protein